MRNIHKWVCKLTEDLGYKLSKTSCKYAAGNLADGLWTHCVKDSHLYGSIMLYLPNTRHMKYLLTCLWVLTQNN